MIMKINRIILSAAVALALAACGTPAEEPNAAADVPQAEVSETTAELSETENAASAETTITTSETTTAEETTTTSAETEKVCTCESEFQHACCEYLNELDFLAGGVYYGDINGDGKPEAVIEINPFEWTYVLYENEKGIQELSLDTMSVYGAVRYIADENRILYSPAFSHSSWGTWGHAEYITFDWNGSDYEVTSVIAREGGSYYEEDGVGHADYGQAYIDGEKVDNDIFEVELAKMQKFINESEYFPIVTIYTYDNGHTLNSNPDMYKNYIKENFPCFDNWDIIPDMQE